jgi:hypothetical protein
VIRRDGLLRRGNEVLVSVAHHLIQLLVKVRELRRLGHDLLLHEEGRLHAREALLGQQRNAVVDQRLVQQQTNAFQEVTAVTSNASAWNQKRKERLEV